MLIHNIVGPVSTVRQIGRMCRIWLRDRYLKHFHGNEFSENTHFTLSLHNHATKDTAELQKLSTIAKATFYRKLKKFTEQGTIKRRQGSGRPRTLNQNDEKWVCQKNWFWEWSGSISNNSIFAILHLCKYGTHAKLTRVSVKHERFFETRKSEYRGWG